MTDSTKLTRYNNYYEGMRKEPDGPFVRYSDVAEVVEALKEAGEAIVEASLLCMDRATGVGRSKSYYESCAKKLDTLAQRAALTSKPNDEFTEGGVMSPTSLPAQMKEKP